MKRRYVVLGLSLVLAISLAVPAFGGPGNPVATAAKSAKSIAKNALKKANAAQTTANTALTTATTALSKANTAQTTANNALTTATNANANANTRIKSSVEEAGPGSGVAATTGTQSDSIACPTGDVLLGGGYFLSGANDNQATVIASEKQLYAGGWFVEGASIGGASQTWGITAEAMCGATS